MMNPTVYGATCGDVIQWDADFRRTLTGVTWGTQRWRKLDRDTGETMLRGSAQGGKLLVEA